MAAAIQAERVGNARADAGAGVSADGRKGDFPMQWKGPALVPDQWDDTFMVYPPGSLEVDFAKVRRLHKAQIEPFIELLERGYTIGLSVVNKSVASLVCEVAQMLKMPLIAGSDCDQNMVYLCKDATLDREE